MGISPTSDLIIDVMRRADPLKAREAAERLAAIGRTARPGPSGDFAAQVKDAILNAGAGERAAAQQVQKPLGLPQGAPAGVRVSEKMSPGEQLEAFVLTSLIETMMPKDAESVFGSGTAGSYWRSMLAEKLAAELTMAGGVGLSEQLKLRDVDQPDAAASLKAVLDARKSPPDVTAEAADALGLRISGSRTLDEVARTLPSEVYAMQPESDGA